MKSVTKRELSSDQITKVSEKAFGKQAKISCIVELTDGYFNNSYLVEIEGEGADKSLKTVLKVAPKADVKVLGYEKDLMEIEVSVLREYSDMDISVPKVLFYDDSCEIIDSPYFFMEHLGGIPLNKVKDQLTKEQYEKLSIDLAKDLVKSKDTVGICFGVPKISDKIFDDWYSCFHFMIMELLEDAEKIGMELPLALNKKVAEGILLKYKNDLEAVTDPILIHKDIWEGNIFVDESTYEYVGMIDCERAIYAEPLLEAVCGFLEENEVFMETYYGTADLSETEKNRVVLYKFYLALLMVVETPYREYEDVEHIKWTDKMLVKVLDVLLG